MKTRFHRQRYREAEARDSIVRRFLRTHALIGLADLTARYPIASALASDLLERWSEDGKVVRVGESDAPELARWAERETLTEMRRATVAVRRGESLAVAPEVFADFLLRRQYVHPATRGEGPAFVELVLEKLQAFSAPAAVWENEILPRRVKGYRHAWLDEVLGQGAWLWRGEGTARDDPRVAFFRRDFDGHPDADMNSFELSADAQHVCAVLDRHGASFATDLARLAAIEPSRARRALRELMNHGAGDQRPLRPSPRGIGRNSPIAFGSSQRAPVGPLAPPPAPAVVVRSSRGALVASSWFSVRSRKLGCSPGSPSCSSVTVFSREKSSLWSHRRHRGVRSPLSCHGRNGEVRYAEVILSKGSRACSMRRQTPQWIWRAWRPQPDADHLVLLCTIDPANLYGAGAPLDIELLEGGVARLPRSPGNFLVLRAGRPVLIIESAGKRLTGLSWARQADIDSALNLLPGLTASRPASS